MNRTVTRALLVFGALSAFVGVSVAGSAETPRARHVERAQEVDRRLSVDESAAPNAEQLADLKTLGKVRVAWDLRQGVPSRLSPDDGFLTDPTAAPADAIARSFLDTHRALFGLSHAQTEAFAVQTNYETEHNHVHQVTLQQLDAGRTVYGALLTFTIDSAGRIVYLAGHASRSAPAAGAPALTAADAVRAAASIEGKQAGELIVVSSEDGPSAHSVFRNTVATGIEDPTPISVELVSFPLAPGKPARLAWKVELEVDITTSDELVVDAQDSDLLLRRSLIQEAAPQGRVFTSQNPNTTQQIVSFAGDPAFDDAGWLGSSSATSGNNVDAYIDNTGDDASDYQTQTPASPDPNF